jgi:uncharacterized protein with PIN domain
MGNNKLQIKLNNISNNYCSKCLSKLSYDKVVDTEDNEFCCEECRRDYWLEIRQDMDDLISEF